MDPVTFPVGPLEIHAYTIFLMLAIAAGSGLFFLGVRSKGLGNQAMMWLYVGALAGGVVGGKLAMLVFLGPDTFADNLPLLARTGMSSTGAIIGGYVGVRLMEIPAGIRCQCDLFAVPLPLAQAIGRIGNFLAADTVGTPTALPWGVDQAGAVRHPVQLYEAGLDLLLFGLLIRLSGRLPHQDDLFRVYLFSYAAIRFPLEFIRHQPTPRYLFGLTLVQHVCLGTMLVCGTWLVWSVMSSRRVPSAQLTGGFAAGE